MSNFGGMAISENLFNWIDKHLPYESTILELGSGTGTKELVKNYTVYSVENLQRWVGYVPESNYIFAPIVPHKCQEQDGTDERRRKGWYDIDVLKEKLPTEYDLFLIDGPLGTIGRWPVLNHLDLFKLDVPIIVDDVKRGAELRIYNEISSLIECDKRIYDDGDFGYGIIIPTNSEIKFND